MAFSLLTVLIALGLLHVWPQLVRRAGDRTFRRWVRQLADTSGAGRVVLVLLGPVAACLLLRWLLGYLPPGELWQALFALVVLLYSLGPHAFEADLEAILRAPDDVHREAAAQALTSEGETVRWDAAALGEAVAYAALRRRFGVLFWFFLLGPVGALAYRLAQTLGHDRSIDMDDASATSATCLANALDWLPAQLLTLTLAVVGHWEAVIGAWRRWHQQAVAQAWYSVGPAFLAAAARAEAHSDIEGGDGYVEERTDPLTEVERLRRALLRALLAWLSAVALVVIGGWVA